MKLFEFKQGSGNHTQLKLHLSRVYVFQLLRSLLLRIENNESTDFSIYGSMVVHGDTEVSPDSVVCSRKFLDGLLSEHLPTEIPKGDDSVLLLLTNGDTVMGAWSRASGYWVSDAMQVDVAKWKYVRWSKDHEESVLQGSEGKVS